MLQGWAITLASFAYLGVLFAIAYYGDRRAAADRSVINNPYIYALSLAVYATSWTFYGSVGRAAISGIGFLPIYLGPTLTAALWWTVLRKIIRISKANRITSIADFIAARYGKSALLGGLVTLVAVIGVVPYIALQLKAISASFIVLTGYPANAGGRRSDIAFSIALLLAAFTILFGTRHLDASERHEGMVAAIAFESLVKLIAFLTVGCFVTFGLYDGFGDLFEHAAEVPALQPLLTMEAGIDFGGWTSLILLSMLAIVFLPRQFQVAVVENVDEKHLDKAIWLLPLYLLAINIFVLPIALAGVMRLLAGADADTFVLSLPLFEHRHGLALLVFIGGLSAATGMIIVETIALSTMVCNDLAMPLLLRLHRRADLSGLVLAVRRAAIVLLMLLGYAYFRLAGEGIALASIGLISFAAVAQFAPAMLGGLYWKNGTRRGAVVGLIAGFLLWAYTLLLPSFAQSVWLDEGPFGIEWLRPQQLFGLRELDPVSHGLFWSMLANLGGYIGCSLFGRQDSVERAQAVLFVDGRAQAEFGARLWRGDASADALRELLRRYLGAERAARFFHQRGAAAPKADPTLLHFAEIELAGAIGAASARAAIASIMDEHPLGHDQLMAVLDETSQAMSYSRELEQKSQELQAASAELKAANQRLTELDQMKDDFVSTVTHELRTPLTSIRAFSEILRDHPELPAVKRTEYLDIVIKESERLTRLINDVLDLARLESGRTEWQVSAFDLRQVIEDAVHASSGLFREKQVQLELALPPAAAPVVADRDRLMQVMLNLLSNAVKFADRAGGRVAVSLEVARGQPRVMVRDNGPGVPPRDRELIFEKFRQGSGMPAGSPQGTGLGLPISREIIGHFGGRLWLDAAAGRGASFVFTLPPAAAREETT